MDLTQMQYFVLVAENGSTAKAASRAGRGTLHEYVSTRPVE